VPRYEFGFFYFGENLKALEIIYGIALSGLLADKKMSM
jgi:hypothetical protein